MRELTDERFSPADDKIIKAKAWKLAGHYGYGTSDVDDIRQDIRCRWIEQSHRHDPTRGSRATFVNTVADNHMANLIEKKTAQRRDNRGDIPIGDADDRALIDGWTDAKQVELQVDLREAMSRLSPELQEIAVRNVNEGEEEIAEAMGLTRAAVRHRLKIIRRHLTEWGFGPDSDDEQPIRR